MCVLRTHVVQNATTTTTSLIYISIPILMSVCVCVCCDDAVFQSLFYQPLFSLSLSLSLFLTPWPAICRYGRGGYKKPAALSLASLSLYFREREERELPRLMFK